MDRTGVLKTSTACFAALCAFVACDGRAGHLPAVSQSATEAGKPRAPDLLAALETAIQDNDLQGIQACLTQGADPNAALPANEWTPLARAVMKDNVNAVRILLKAGADPTRDAQPMHGAWPLLFVAVAVDNPDIMRELVHAGADPNMRILARGGLTPLASAADLGATNACGVLPRLGAVLDAWNLWPEAAYPRETFRPGVNRGRTALMIAAARGQRDCLEQLLLEGARPDLRNERGETAADLVGEYVSPVPSILEALRRTPVPSVRTK